MKSGYFFLLFSLLIGLVACDDETGIQEIELILETDPFDRIRFETSSDIKVFQDDEFKVVITGLEHDVNDVEVRVVNDRLTIEEHGAQDPELVIEVYVRDISQLENTGSSLVYGESFFVQDRNIDFINSGSGEIDFAIETDNVDVDLSGSGYIYLEGDVETLDVDVSGSGWFRAFSLETGLTDVRIEGSGSAEVKVDADLDVFIFGSGDVYYKGHPNIDAEITGSGELIDAN